MFEKLVCISPLYFRSPVAHRKIKWQDMVTSFGRKIFFKLSLYSRMLDSQCMHHAEGVAAMLG